MAGSSDGSALDQTLPANDVPRVHDGPPEPLVRGSVVGRYVVIDQVGAGAMGVVFAAYDPQLDRKVALKVLRPRASDLAVARERLQREAQALAKLGHPNVVTVYDVGVYEDQLFVAMEFVEGQTLRAWMESAAASSTGSIAAARASGEAPVGVRPWREVLGVFTQAGRGLAAAHEAGLIHRDFKPDNVMLSEDGRVRVMDFGLARPNEPGLAVTQPSTEVEVLTRTGAILGTPAYMPLEQFSGGLVDARSDQFSFCVALHEALHGARPFDGETVGELMVNLVKGEVRAASTRGAAIPGWVRAVVLRGLAPKPDERFPSMQVLLEALASDPVARRRRIALRLGLVLALGASMWGVLALSGKVEQRDAVIEEQAGELERQNAALERQLSVQRGLRASMLVGTRNEAEALSLGVQAVGAYAGAWADAPREALMGLEQVLAHDPVIAKASHVLRGHEDYLSHVAYSPDGTRLATASQDGTARIWDPVRGELLRTLGDHGGEVYHLAFSPDGARLATTSTDGRARIWDVESGECLVTLVGHEAALLVLEFSPDGARLATAGLERSVRVWDARTGARLVTVEGDERTVRDLAFDPEGIRLVTAGTDGVARVWDATTGARLLTLTGHEGTILAVAVAPDGTRVATAGMDRRARIWSLETGERVATLEGHTDRIANLAYSPDGKRLTTVSWDSTGRVYDTRTGALVTALEGGHRTGVVSLAYAPDGSSVATGDFGGNIDLWDLESGKLRARLRGHKADVWGLAFAPDGRQLASASVDRSARLWDLDEPRVEVLEGFETNVRGFSYSRDRAFLATVSLDGRLRLWSGDTQDLLHTLDEGDDDPAQIISISPDGTRLVAKGHRWLRSWDTQTGTLVATRRWADQERRGGLGHSPAGTFVHLGDGHHFSSFDARTLEPLATIEYAKSGTERGLSSDDERLALADDTSTVTLLDPRTGALLAELESPGEAIGFAAFSPDGTALATYSERVGVRIWDAHRLTLRATVPELLGVNHLAYSPDGGLLAGGGGAVGVVIWDVKAGEVFVRIEPDDLETGTGRVRFSGDGSRFVVSSSGFLRVHDTATGQRLAYIERMFAGAVDLSVDGTRLTLIGPDQTLEIWDVDAAEPLTRARVGLVHAEGSTVWPIPPRELTRIGCARLRVFDRAYPEARRVCDPLLVDRG